jgi:hypothetical protein
MNLFIISQTFTIVTYVLHVILRWQLGREHFFWQLSCRKGADMTDLREKPALTAGGSWPELATYGKHAADWQADGL